MIDFVNSHNIENNCNMSYSNAVMLNKELVLDNALNEHHYLIKKETNYIILF